MANFASDAIKKPEMETSLHCCLKLCMVDSPANPSVSPANWLLLLIDLSQIADTHHLASLEALAWETCTYYPDCSFCHITWLPGDLVEWPLQLASSL
jgi:hypothetical protein